MDKNFVRVDLCTSWLVYDLTCVRLDQESLTFFCDMFITRIQSELWIECCRPYHRGRLSKIFLPNLERKYFHTNPEAKGKAMSMEILDEVLPWATFQYVFMTGFVYVWPILTWNKVSLPSIACLAKFWESAKFMILFQESQDKSHKTLIINKEEHRLTKADQRDFGLVQRGFGLA